MGSVNAEIIKERECKSMSYISAKVKLNNCGELVLPYQMQRKLGVEKGDILQLVATGNIIVIEKCEEENED